MYLKFRSVSQYLRDSGDVLLAYCLSHFTDRLLPATSHVIRASSLSVLWDRITSKSMLWSTCLKNEIWYCWWRMMMRQSFQNPYSRLFEAWQSTRNQGIIGQHQQSGLSVHTGDVARLGPILSDRSGFPPIVMQTRRSALGIFPACRIVKHYCLPRPVQGLAWIRYVASERTTSETLRAWSPHFRGHERASATRRPHKS